MTQEEKIIYLNEIVSSNFKNDYRGPKTLYKYRTFDKYTFDMLNNDYIFLCPAEEEDDETECLTTTNLDEMIDSNSGNLSKKYLNKIIELIKPSTSNNNYEIVKNIIFEIAEKEGTNPIKFSEDITNELQKMTPDGVNVSSIVKTIDSIPEILKKPKIREILELVFKTVLESRKKIGICSFSETNDIDDMWKKYADNSSGYCIEYDLTDYEFAKNILPVIYQDERETNIIIQFTGTVLGLFIRAQSKGLIPADVSHFIRLILTKYKKWEYQKEWRYLGLANCKPKAPPIKTIYFGKNITSINERHMREYASVHNIDVVKSN